MYFKLVTALVGILMFAGLANAAPFAYIANSGDNTVSVLDTKTDSFVAQIQLGDGTGPFGVAVSPDGKKVYISNQLNQTISVIDALSDPEYPSVINTIAGLTGVPSGLAISPAGTLYVATNAGGGTLSVIDVSNLPPDTTVTPNMVNIAVGNLPMGVTLSGGYVYVTNNGSGTVSIIDTATNTKINDVAVGTGPVGLAVSKNQDKIFVANSGSDNVSVIRTYDGFVSNISTGPGSKPYGVAVDSTTGLVYVSNSGASGGDTVSVIDPANNAITTTYILPAGSAPQSIAVTADGLVYTVNDLGGIAKEGSLTTFNTKIQPATITEIKNPDNWVFFSNPNSLGNFLGPHLYTITATAGANGTISPTGGNLFLPDTNAIFTITANNDYRLNNVSIDGNIIENTDPNLVKVNASTWQYTFTKVNNTHSIDVTFIKDFDYVSVSIKDNKPWGRVISTPGTISSINCSTSTDAYLCNALFEEGASVTLTAEPYAGKYFVRWIGDKSQVSDTITKYINNGELCDGFTTTTCSFTMTNYTHVTAEFTDVPAGSIKMLPQGTMFNTIQDAFNAVTTTTSEIQLSVKDFAENPTTVFNNAVPFTLSTGWDSSFQNKGATPSTITGTLTIGQGTVVADNVVIK